MTKKFEYKVENHSGVPNYHVTQFQTKKNDVALVIPVINEGIRIRDQLSKIMKSSYSVDIIIADGGSNDGSLQYFNDQENDLVALLVKEGGGKLSAQLRMAFHYCLENDYRSVITMDGNDKDGLLGIEAIQRALKEGYDFIQGSRFIPGGVSRNTPIKRYLGIRLIHAPLTSLGARRKYTDTTNGFRGHSRALLENSKIRIFRDIFSEYELLAYIPIEASLQRMRVTEVPVMREYPPNGEVPTKINNLSIELKLIGVLLNAVFGRYRPKN